MPQARLGSVTSQGFKDLRLLVAKGHTLWRRRDLPQQTLKYMAAKGHAAVNATNEGTCRSKRNKYMAAKGHAANIYIYIYIYVYIYIYTYLHIHMYIYTNIISICLYLCQAPCLHGCSVTANRMDDETLGHAQGGMPICGKGPRRTKCLKQSCLQLGSSSHCVIVFLCVPTDHIQEAIPENCCIPRQCFLELLKAWGFLLT